MLNAPLKVTTTFVFLLGVSTLAASAAFAQEDKSTRVGGPTPSVTGTASRDRVRIAAPSAVVQLRLEVYDEAGQKLLDTEQRGGNVLDWHLQDGSGQRVADGAYLCVVTVKNLSGRLSQKLGLVTVSGEATKLRPAGVAELSPRQAQAVGPIEGEDEGLAVMSTIDAQPVTVLANNGDEAQLARTRGALTFRIGDFFTGNDQEQMRLTEEGDLGIGTATPKAKLDVAGTIRARGGFAFSDGSTLNVNDKGALTVTGANGNVVPNVAGTGTLNRLAKWTETGGAGTLGDSQLGETGGGIELRPAGAAVGINPIFINPSNLSGFSLLQAYPSTGPNTNLSFAVVPRGTGAANNRAQISLFNTDFIADSTNYEFAALRARGTDYVFGTGKSGTGLNRPIMFAAGFLSDNTTNNGQLFLDSNGRVGVGTITPSFKLEVIDPASTGLRVQTNTAGGTVASFGGFGGFQIDAPGVAGGRFAVTESGRVGVGTNSPLAKLDLLGGANDDGSSDPQAMAFQWRNGGFRHWIRTRHNQTLGRGNAIDFFVNDSNFQDGSQGPGVGSIHVMTLDSGRVGIGTTDPTEKLTVVGIVQSTAGFKFPDGSLQTTAAAAANTTFTTLVKNPLSGNTVAVPNTGPAASILHLDFPTGGTYLVTATVAFSSTQNNFRTFFCKFQGPLSSDSEDYWGTLGSFGAQTMTFHAVMNLLEPAFVDLKCHGGLDLNSNDQNGVSAWSRRLTAVKIPGNFSVQ